MFCDMASRIQEEVALPKELEVSLAGKPDDGIHTSILEVNYPSEKWAMIVMNALSVDSELQPDKLQREISVHGSKLRVGFTTRDVRLLRAAFNAFMDMLILATRTIEQFGPPKQTSANV